MSLLGKTMGQKSRWSPKLVTDLKGKCRTSKYNYLCLPGPKLTKRKFTILNSVRLPPISNIYLGSGSHTKQSDYTVKTVRN